MYTQYEFNSCFLNLGLDFLWSEMKHFILLLIPSWICFLPAKTFESTLSPTQQGVMKHKEKSIERWRLCEWMRMDGGTDVTSRGRSLRRDNFRVTVSESIRPKERLDALLPLSHLLIPGKIEKEGGYTAFEEFVNRIVVTGINQISYKRRVHIFSIPVTNNEQGRICKSRRRGRGEGKGEDL